MTVPSVASDPVAEAAASLERRTGLRLPVGSRMRLQDSLATRASLTRGGDLDRYVSLLDSDPHEVDSLFDLVSVGQTAFLRHPELFEALEATVLPECAARTGAVHIVSAGCSTGEEAWTLAACAASRLGDSKSRVTAVDWCREALEVARAGRYPATAVAGLPQSYRRWFESCDHGGGHGVVARPMLRERVRFVRANLRRPCPSFDPADVILFCNVGIYFDKAVTEEVVANLTSVLRPGGHLFLGSAESLWGLDHELELVELGDVFAYRRPSADSRNRRGGPEPTSVVRTQDAAARVWSRITTRVEAREALASAQAALVRGELDGAARAARTVLDHDEFHVEAHFVLASVADRGGADDAVDAYRRVLYLDPDFALARACNATLLERGGHSRRAAAEYHVAARGLAAAPSRYEPYLEAMSVDLLADACRRRARALHVDGTCAVDQWAGPQRHESEGPPPATPALPGRWFPGP